LKHDWSRVILDEAHGIKNTTTAISKACCLLCAPKRWCVTGTPIQNSLKDVYGLVKFLKHEPWCDASFWRRMITDVMNDTNNNNKEKNNKNKKEGTGRDKKTKSEDDEEEEDVDVDGEGFRTALGRVKRLLMPMMIRRTKQSLDKNGKPILTLPPVETHIIKVQFSDPERQFYNALLDRSLSVFEGFIHAGTASKSWLAIFSLLQRLRQACDHVALTVKTSLEESGDDTDHIFNNKNLLGGGGSKQAEANKRGISRNNAKASSFAKSCDGEDEAESSSLIVVKESVNDEVRTSMYCMLPYTALDIDASCCSMCSVLSLASCYVCFVLVVLKMHGCFSHLFLFLTTSHITLLILTVSARPAEKVPASKCVIYILLRRCQWQCQ
jgi:SNF2 family DNA or RNA helicase